MELKVNEIQTLAPVTFNYEEIKQELTSNLSNYKGLIYTEDTIKEAKENRAKLKKLAEAINSRRIELERKFLEPFQEFKGKTKELDEMIKEVVIEIDTQIKEFDNKKKEEKLREIEKIFEENVGDYKDILNLDKIYNEKWTNVTYTIKQIENEIKHIIAKAKMDLTTIEQQIKDTNVNNQVKLFYFENINNPSILSLSLQEGVKIVENTKKLQELKKEELQQIQVNQNISTKSTLTAETDIEKNVLQNENNSNISTSEELQQIDFRVWVTQEQKFCLREFLVSNNIKYGRVGN